MPKHVLIVILSLAAVVGIGVRSRADENPPAAPSRPVHADADELVARVLDTTRAFLSEDPVAARASLDALKKATPPLHPDDDAVYGSEMINLDGAFHVTIDLAREHVTAGRIDSGFDQFVWVQRTCVKCHRLARETGWMKTD